MKPRYIPAWLDALLWRFRYYRRHRMRATASYTITPIQMQYLREKIEDEAIIRGRDLL